MHNSPPARLTTGHSRGVKRLHIWLSLLFLLSWFCPAGRELEEVGRRKMAGRGLNLREGGREQPGHGFLTQPARKLLTHPPQGTIRGLW